MEEYNAKDKIIIEQVKEKWGALRFYYLFDLFSLADEEKLQELKEKMYQLVAEWEEETFEICCFCGTKKDVHIYGKWWVHHACADCERKVIQERENKYKEWLMTEEGQEYLQRKKEKHEMS